MFFVGDSGTRTFFSDSGTRTCFLFVTVVHVHVFFVTVAHVHFFLFVTVVHVHVFCLWQWYTYMFFLWPWHTYIFFVCDSGTRTCFFVCDSGTRTCFFVTGTRTCFLWQWYTYMLFVTVVRVHVFFLTVVHVNVFLFVRVVREKEVWKALCYTYISRRIHTVSHLCIILEVIYFSRSFIYVCCLINSSIVLVETELYC
jgi:hypothetical protein